MPGGADGDLRRRRDRVARNDKGQRYTALPAAFAFRSKPVNGCACNDPTSSQAYFEKSARTDPTLQSGDVIVETDGAFVYSGRRFVPLGTAAMSTQLRERLRAMLRRTHGAKSPLDDGEINAAESHVEVSKDERAATTPR